MQANKYFISSLENKLQKQVSGKVVITCDSDILTVKIFSPMGSNFQNYTYQQYSINDEIFRGYTDSTRKAQQIIRAYEKWILSNFFPSRYH